MKVRSFIFPAVLILLAGMCSDQCCPSAVRLRKISTEHLGRLTGTTLNSARDIGITGTDLGASFADPSGSNRIIFLFGDTWTTDRQRWDQDSTASAWPVVPDKNKLPKLMWNYDGNSNFSRINIPNVDLGGMNVPVEGLVANGKIYIFASTGFDGVRHSSSALAHTDGIAFEPDALTLDHVVPSEKFINISSFTEGETVWIFGSGPYRKSSIYLAKVDQSQLGQRDQWSYYQGTVNGAPQFGPDEASAIPIVYSGGIGEFSVRKQTELGYLMLYNSDRDGPIPRGIHLRRSDEPWGLWAAPINIFDAAHPRATGGT